MWARTLRRALLEAPSSLPQPHVLPRSWTAALSTIPNSSTTSTGIPPIAPQSSTSIQSPVSESSTITLDAPQLPSFEDLTNPRPTLSPSVRELLPLLRSQGPHYITIHIHGNPYLVTQGDSVRLPFLMHGVEPGDVLRLDRAINLGSRDFTLKAPAPPPKRKSGTMASPTVADLTGSTPESVVPHFIPHLAKERYSYIDPRLFVCRAVVTGVESEPMRIKEKTKRRQRHIRKVKSKHRYTIIKIKELRINSVEEIVNGTDQL